MSFVYRRKLVLQNVMNVALLLFCVNELWFQHNIITLNPAYVQMPDCFLSVKEAKYLKGRFVSKGSAGSRINVRKHKVNAVLGEAVKRVGVWDDIAYVVVIVFDMWLLA